MALLIDIKARDWQVSIAGSGVVAQGLDDVQQCIDIILRTQKGSDPLRPQFGSDIYNYIDKPAPVAIPNIKRCIIDALELWEQRIQIVSITHIQLAHNLQFFITYTVVDDDLEQTLQLYLGGGSSLVTGIIQGLILEGIFPVGFAGHQLKINFQVDGRAAAPTPPAFGFSSPAAMLTWVRANWSVYGRWYLLPDRIVLFMPPLIATTGSITITRADIFRYAFTLPVLSIGEQFQVVFTSGHMISTGVTSGPLTSPGFLTMSDMLIWLNANWNFSDVTWSIENAVDTAGDFDSSDFDTSDFSTQNISYILVAYTTDFDSFSFEVNAI